MHSILAVLPYPQGKALAENERPSLSVLQKYHKFPMIVTDCREFFVPLRAILNYDTEKDSQGNAGKN